MARKASPWYRLLDHTGDMALLVRAPSLEELYDAVTRAFFDVMLDVRTIEPRESLSVTVESAADSEDLLVRYLSELLFYHDAHGWLFCGASVLNLTRQSIEAKVAGERFDPARHSIDRQVKAVTYHRLLISQDRDGWTARCVLDL